MALPANAGAAREEGLIPGQQDPLKEGMATQPIPVFLPG